MSRLSDVIRLIRPREWVKNGFVLAALFFTPNAFTLENLGLSSAMAAAFALAASAVYVGNDILDRHSDRLHPRKAQRPIAAGRVSVAAALTLCAGMAAAAIAAAYAIGDAALLPLLVYLAINVAYCLWLKHVSIIDVMIISAGFVLRLLAGAAVINATPSPWIVVMTGLVALFMALAKRRDDLILTLDGSHRRSLDGYNRPFIDAAIMLSVGTTLVAYILYCLEPSVIARVGTDRLYYTVPFVVVGLLRYLQITLVEERSGSPTGIVTSDPLIIVTVGGWIAAFGYLLYG